MKKISIIIPCYNEKYTVEEVIHRVKMSNISNLEIILVDDNSNDGTKQILEKKIHTLVDKIVYHEKNLGKGAAIQSGLKLVSGDIIIIQDADLEYDPKDYKKLLEPFYSNNADVVYGSRFFGGESRRIIYFKNQLANKFLTFISNIFTGLNLTDMETGYKCFTKKAVKNINLIEKSFGFEPEITAKLAKKKLKFFEVGISYYGRTYEEGKKIRPIDGLKALICIIKYNLFS